MGGTCTSILMGSQTHHYASRPFGGLPVKGNATHVVQCLVGSVGLVFDSMKHVKEKSPRRTMLESCVYDKGHKSMRCSKVSGFYVPCHTSRIPRVQVLVISSILCIISSKTTPFHPKRHTTRRVEYPPGATLQRS